MISIFQQVLFFAFFSFQLLNAQSLPDEMRIEDGHLISGGSFVAEWFDLNQVHKIEVSFEEPDWFELMDGPGGPPGPGGGGADGELVMGTMIVNDTIVLDSVMVGIKGQTSDFANNSEKKSFKFEIDALKNQDLMGYDALNLNCGFLDPSAMREVLYYDVCKEFTTSLKANFVDLYINGEYWGPYSNVQQLEGSYIKEWFMNNDGTRWRALPIGNTGPGGGGGGPGGGGGGQFGTGSSTLNYNGPDSTDYNEDYTLKRTKSLDPWQDLVDACDALNNLPIDNIYDSLKYHIDLDRALWFLAQENIFADDDSYIYKGGMDYYVFWDQFSDRIIPLEVDGNTILLEEHADWSPFFNEDDTDFPLMNRLFANDEIRQRYLAHYRTILEEYFTEENVFPRMDSMAVILDERIQNDPKKIYSYNEHLSDIDDLKTIITERIELLNNNSEVDVEGLGFGSLGYMTDNGANTAPSGGASALVEVQVLDDQSQGINTVNLYYGAGLQGVMERVAMQDEGNGIYSGQIPGFPASSYVRFYVEAIADNLTQTAAYFPKGAEHDVFVYQVEVGDAIEGALVINEFMASNSDWMADELGEFDDWIEIYNTSDIEVSLNNYHLSDSQGNPLKWGFPYDLVIPADGYLIVWADDDEEQGSLHANFKLSGSGETIYLSNATGDIIDQVEYGQQDENLSYARIPNGTGDFVIKDATFGFNNEQTSSIPGLEEAGLAVFPNPTNGDLFITAKSSESIPIVLYNMLGQKLKEDQLINSLYLDLSHFENGSYLLKLGSESFIVNKI